ncbi:MAG: TIR domain-containing protein [Eubacteriales bacterium]|nr:TIR domain-containing protein [Eubacteriales bacterium]MDD4444202.1 TIR domain-containing protein [Eubacteriales bacterium]
MGLFDKFKKQETPKSILVSGMGRMPFPAYHGNEPYIFISYAHVDAAKVFAEIKNFNKSGYNVWYDEGISPGNEWTDEIADSLEKCSLFVVFITPASAISPNVLNEINYAIDEKKPFIAIHLQETTLRAGIKLQIGAKQAILKYNMTNEEYLYKYTSAFERLGVKQKDGYGMQESIVSAISSGPAVSAKEYTTTISEPPSDEIELIGDFQIEHGLLRDYLGNNPDIKLPDEVQIIGNSSFAKGASVIETVNLNRTGALLNNAFANCPKLHEIRIPSSVTMIQERPFVNCPKLTLYCHRNQLPKDFEKNFGGKDIVYLEET